MRRWLDRWMHTERVVPPMTGREWLRYVAVVFAAGPAMAGAGLLAGWLLSFLPVPGFLRFLATVCIAGLVGGPILAWLPAGDRRRQATQESYLITALLACEAALLYALFL